MTPDAARAASATHHARPDPLSWPVLVRRLTDTLLDLPGDGVAELLLPRAALGLTWLAPGRLLISLGGAPVDAGPALVRRGWRWRDGTWHLLLRSSSGRAGLRAPGAEEAVGVVRDVLGAAAGDVELWRPRCSPPSGPAWGADGPEEEGLW